MTVWLTVLQIFEVIWQFFHSSSLLNSNKTLFIFKKSLSFCPFCSFFKLFFRSSADFCFFFQQLYLSSFLIGQCNAPLSGVGIFLFGETFFYGPFVIDASFSSIRFVCVMSCKIISISLVSISVGLIIGHVLQNVTCGFLWSIFNKGLCVSNNVACRWF